MTTNTNGTDVAVALAKGVIGAAPVVGPIAAEIVSILIPNQRLDRIARLVECIEAKVAHLDASQVRSKMKAPTFIDLLEDGFLQASRATSSERLDYLSSVLKNSLTEGALQHIEIKRILGLLFEINDVEVIILASHWHEGHSQESEEFWFTHKAVLAPRGVHFGSSDQELDGAAVHSSYEDHLVRLGLLKIRFRRPGRNEMPEFDERTGMIKAAGHEITRLGDLLLRQIDMATLDRSAGDAAQV